MWNLKSSNQRNLLRKEKSQNVVKPIILKSSKKKLNVVNRKCMLRKENLEYPMNHIHDIDEAYFKQINLFIFIQYS